MRVLQIQDITADELIDRMRSAITISPKQINPAAMNSVMITVLNKRNAAKTLNISETFFDKLQSRGIIPATVNSGVNHKGELIQRWAQHHLIAIKPIILQLKHTRNDIDFSIAREKVTEILGL